MLETECWIWPLDDTFSLDNTIQLINGSTIASGLVFALVTWNWTDALDYSLKCGL